MALTGQLRDGQLGQWCAATLPGTPAVAAAVAAQLAATTRDRPPVRPGQVTGPDYWATLGGALGQRLAFATHHAPPYPALLGAHRAGLTDWATLDVAAAAFPTHARYTGAAGPRGALQHRPLPDGGWLDLDAEPAAELRGRATTGTRPALLLDLARRLAAFLPAHAPPGRLADTRGAETVLARACVVLTDLETAYRSGAPTDQTAARWANPDTTVDTLLAAVDPALAGELVELATRAHTTATLARLAGGIAAPVFVEHWAEGDLLTPPPPGSTGADGPGGYTLLDVKTVLSARDPDKVARWLWQLLGYAWLDHTRGDRHHITRVGLYFARHGHTVTWTVHELAVRLLDGAPAGPARAAFLDLACAVWRREAGRAPHPPT